MNGLVRGDFIRAATFFTLAFGCMSIGGFLIGTPRIGVRWGLGLGAAFAVFAYFFLEPTAEDPDPPRDP
ncbi:hypothetical protein KM295_04675 [Natronomonas sp. F2-12]|jgi:hypothetical protein|uniref:Uncharacterized protein n=1 Tax=Natronomonas aquatica TaxID=2841590 RepID=A0A9R1CSC1_9EURY|nr:hypothetical protein [Natronomonas aquatica]MCQ4332799.1 hypothetical protein [Natronomonas aquatica]